MLRKEINFNVLYDVKLSELLIADEMTNFSFQVRCVQQM